MLIVRMTITLFKRFFGLLENVPLYIMLGTACSLAVYTPIRHLSNTPDIALDRKARDFGDNIAANQRYIEKASNYKNNIFTSYIKLYKTSDQ